MSEILPSIPYLQFQTPVTNIVRELRNELLPTAFENVNWAACRNRVAAEDLYTPHTWMLNAFFACCNTYEYFALPWLRRRALDWIYQVIKKEDEFTNHICIGPVNKVINMICVWCGRGQGVWKMGRTLFL